MSIEAVAFYPNPLRWFCLGPVALCITSDGAP